METRTEPQHKKPNWEVFAISVLLTGLIMYNCMGNDGNKSPKSESTKKIECYVQAKEIVKNKLRSPSTAEFPGAYEYVKHITKIDENTFEINSYVDSQNGFGAVGRSFFTIRIVYANDELSSWSNFKIKK